MHISLISKICALLSFTYSYNDYLIFVFQSTVSNIMAGHGIVYHPHAGFTFNSMYPIFALLGDEL